LGGIIHNMLQQLSPFVKTAWVLIILFVGALAVHQANPEGVDNAGNSEDATGLVIVRLQAELILGGSPEVSSSSAAMLNVGTVGQRQRYIAFMIALDDLDAASAAVLGMQAGLISEGMEMTEQESMTQELLGILIEGGKLPPEHTPLVVTLGWFGTFLQADEAQRKEIKNTAEKKVMIASTVVFLVGLAAVIGLVFVILKLVKAFDGQLESGLAHPEKNHGIYAEVFVLWLLALIGFQMLAGFIGKLVANGNVAMSLLFVLIAFFGSLVVLFWARIRGISFKQILVDIGWTTGRGLMRETLTGIAGYAMMLPFLGIGVSITLLLFVVQQFLTGGAGAESFQGTGGGSHPIIVDLSHGVWSTKLLLVFMAAVAAPVVEETVFRGVLYRQLRSSSCKFPKTLSIIFSVFLVSFVFAAIHPQGWIAIPALMGIAVGMNLMREWRGSLIPSMVVHGVSNGIVVSMMVLMLS